MPAIQHGQILKLELNSGHCLFEPFPEQGTGYFDGRGFNIWYLFHHLAQGGTDPPCTSEKPVYLYNIYASLEWDKNGIPAYPEEIRNITTPEDLR